MCVVNIYEAKTNFSKLIEAIERGEEKEIIVCRYGKKIAKIVPHTKDEKTKRLGAAKGKIPSLNVDLKDTSLFGDLSKEFGY